MKQLINVVKILGKGLGIVIVSELVGNGALWIMGVIPGLPGLVLSLLLGLGVLGIAVNKLGKL
jgi:hypothetical protein